MFGTSKILLLALQILATTVLAGGFGTGALNWGCSAAQRQSAPQQVKNQCSAAGSFLLSVSGHTICSSPSTRSEPSGDSCPLNWSWHAGEGCCVPQKEVEVCDCGEGYSWNTNAYKCKSNPSKSCGQGTWWHERSNTCCPDSPGGEEGTCPKGKTCPTGWYWNTKFSQCKPKTKRSPGPDCGNWDDRNQCCGGGSQPSQGAGKRGNQGGQKRDFIARQQIAFPQSDTDAIYCPAPLHACSISARTSPISDPTSGEWVYECVDFATELESCGGCASTGEGTDCTSIPHAFAVGCEAGACAVYSCKAGFKANGTECVSA